jgi:beta-xylosidase
MVQWQEHPSPLQATDFSWARGDAFGSQVVAHDGKFYWYAAVTHDTIAGKAIGVAVANTPLGPFYDARGSALVTNDMVDALPGSMNNLDPTVIVSDEGQAYLFWGHSQAYYARLHPNMMELDGPIHTLDLPGFQEGSRLYKRNGWYYLSYGYGMPEKIVYAMSRSLEGPWTYKGILNEVVGNCQTNSGVILDHNGQHYFIYHNGALREGSSHRRSVCIDYLYFNDDDTIRRVVMTSEGVTIAAQT